MIQSNPSDRTSTAITLDPTVRDTSDPEVRNRWRFSFQISWKSRANDPSIQTKRLLVSLCKTTRSVPNRLSFAIIFKLLTIIAKILVLTGL